jgi:cysteine-rich repeat protein
MVFSHIKRGWAQTRTCCRCDDGNTLSDDGCSLECIIEPAWYCDAATCGTSACYTKCGDGLRAGLERCDDGNNRSMDGCNGTCYVECGFECRGGSSAARDRCTPVCGDGILSYGEEYVCLRPLIYVHGCAYQHRYSIHYCSFHALDAQHALMGTRARAAGAMTATCSKTTDAQAPAKFSRVGTVTVLYAAARGATPSAAMGCGQGSSLKPVDAKTRTIVAWMAATARATWSAAGHAPGGRHPVRTFVRLRVATASKRGSRSVTMAMYTLLMVSLIVCICVCVCVCVCVFVCICGLEVVCIGHDHAPRGGCLPYTHFRCLPKP